MGAVKPVDVHRALAGQELAVGHDRPLVVGPGEGSPRTPGAAPEVRPRLRRVPDGPRVHGAIDVPPRPAALGRRKDGGIGAVRAWYLALVAPPAHASPAPLDHPHVIAAIDAGRGLTNEGYTFLTAGDHEEFLSWDGLRSEVMNAAAHLRALGLRPGDRLAMVMPDGDDFVPTFLGAVCAGIIPVPLYPPLSLGQARRIPRGARGDHECAPSRRTSPPTRSSRRCCGARAARVPSLKGVITAEALRTEAPAVASREPADIGADDLAFLQFTSGSTSTAEGRRWSRTRTCARTPGPSCIDGLDVDADDDRGVSVAAAATTTWGSSAS